MKKKEKVDIFKLVRLKNIEKEKVHFKSLSVRFLFDLFVKNY